MEVTALTTLFDDLQVRLANGSYRSVDTQIMRQLYESGRRAIDLSHRISIDVADQMAALFIEFENLLKRDDLTPAERHELMAYQLEMMNDFMQILERAHAAIVRSSSELGRDIESAYRWR